MTCSVKKSYTKNTAEISIKPLSAIIKPLSAIPKGALYNIR